MKPKSSAIRHFRSLMFAGSAAVTLASHAAHAGTITWDSANATTTSWALGSNWIGGVAPVAGDDVVVTADGVFDPTVNSAYTGIAINSLTLQGSTNLFLGSPLQVGAGGVYNNSTSNNLFLGAMTLTADQTWGGTRTIFQTGVVSGGAFKLTYEGTDIRFDNNNPSWTGGVDIRTTVNTGGSFAGSATMTPWGTGTLTLINQKTDGTRTTSILNMASAVSNFSQATAATLANNIVLSGPNTGNFIINQSNDASTLAGGHWYNLTGNITGAVNTSRTLTFQNSKGVNAPVTYILSGTNTYAAQTVIGANTTLQIGNGGTLGTLGSSTAAILNSGTLAINRSDALSVGNVISGAGGLWQFGGGTTTLSGNNTYTGTTSVTAGTLIIGASGSLANTTTTIGVGGTLAGGGTIGGATTIQGTHTPGFSPGTQTFTNGLSYADTATLNWELTANSTAGRGTSYDAVDVTGGSFALATGASIDLTFGGTVDFLNAFWGLNREWLVVDLSGSATAADSNVFTIGTITGGANWNPALGSFGMLRKDGSTTADAVYLTWTAVPEPSAALLGGLGLLVLLRRRRCA